MKRQIIFVHGFGVGKDARGLFTDIENHFPQHDFFYLDLNDVDPVTGNMRVLPLEDQAKRLAGHIASLPVRIDTVIAHSMGCLVTALMEKPDFKHMIFIAPPRQFNIQKTVQTFRDRPGSHIDLAGESILARADGTQTLVPSSFWSSREDPDNAPENLYRKLPPCRVDFIIANQDEILEGCSLENLPDSIRQHPLDGDHNFSGATRTQLLQKIESILHQLARAS